MCSCASSACTQPLLTRVRGDSANPGTGARCGCVCLGSGFGCAPPLLAGVLGDVFSCARSARTPPLLAGVRGVGVCVWARVSAAPRPSWLGCWAVCVLVCALRLHPATPGTGARCGCACLGSSFGCAPPLLAEVLGCPCAHVRAPLAPSHSWHGCAVWVCVFGFGFLAAPRHSWLGRWAVCVLVCALCLHPATPAPGARCGCVCSGSGFGCAPPLCAGVCGVLVGSCLAPVRVPWFVACCARSPGLWHPTAVAAWHLSVCLGCGRRGASLACLVAPRGAPRLIWSGRSWCSCRLSRRRGAFPHPGGLRPRLYWAAARGTRRPAETRALCACRWPPPRRERWARSASYSFGAP